MASSASRPPHNQEQHSSLESPWCWSAAPTCPGFFVSGRHQVYESFRTTFRITPLLLAGGLSCQCQLQNGVTTSACNGDSRVRLSGTGNTCTMTINGEVGDQDGGRYKCVLADSGDIQTTSRAIDVLVTRLYQASHDYKLYYSPGWHRVIASMG